MLYDCKAESRASLLARATLVHTIESFEEVWQMSWLNTLAVVLKADTAHIIVVFKQRDIDIFALGIGDSILG